MRQRRLVILGFCLCTTGCDTDTLRPDGLPPAAVTDLKATVFADSAIALTWTAPGDDGMSGRAAAYDVRYALSPDTTLTWWTDVALALQVALSPRTPAGHWHTTSASVVQGITILRAAEFGDDYSAPPRSGATARLIPVAVTSTFTTKAASVWNAVRSIMLL